MVSPVSTTGKYATDMLMLVFEFSRIRSLSHLELISLLFFSAVYLFSVLFPCIVQSPTRSGSQPSHADGLDLIVHADPNGSPDGHPHQAISMGLD